MSIVARIRAQGGDAIRDGWTFRVKRGRLTDGDIEWIAQHKREVMRELWPDFDDWEERAAIRQFCGGQSKDVAEREAYKEIAGC